MHYDFIVTYTKLLLLSCTCFNLIMDFQFNCSAFTPFTTAYFTVVVAVVVVTVAIPNDNVHTVATFAFACDLLCNLMENNVKLPLC